MTKKKKYYVVWEGRSIGIFEDWASCKAQVDNFQGAKYKSFETEKEAVEALKKDFKKVMAESRKNEVKVPKSAMPPPLKDAVVVDAACSGATGDMEYQGFEFRTGKRLFHKGVFKDATNNIGEFLAIVHALAFLKKHGSDLPIYSDSKTAISWVKKKTANTKLEKTERNAEIFQLLTRAEAWLRNNSFSTKILKWETEYWGENPADFGRK